MRVSILHDLNITPRQLVGIFLLFKRQEAELDTDQEQLYRKILQFLYEHLSIYQIENLEMLYVTGLDFAELNKEFLHE